MKRRTDRSLTLFVILSMIMTFISALQVAANMYEGRPVWFIDILLIPIPIFAFMTVVIFLDLVKQDYLTLQGRIKARSENKIVVHVGNGKMKTFRLRNEYVDAVDVENDIEIIFYKRTRAVIGLTNSTR
ncbi:hypothetical protein [Paenibacillus sp. N3.4]|uniref:hypothetical protein n=1 Tax=Paenibacillus sp. N3.4 TaxID=2603222 RepID=UPI0011CB4BC9|nr:hypothetical protein [Paenibacillus sp. N3.4]TXK78383.1 hypothetical protein FU659_20455 [Paenibacillus sp. N3.4]